MFFFFFLLLLNCPIKDLLGINFPSEVCVLELGEDQEVEGGEIKRKYLKYTWVCVEQICISYYF